MKPPSVVDVSPGILNSTTAPSLTGQGNLCLLFRNEKNHAYIEHSKDSTVALTSWLWCRLLSIYQITRTISPARFIIELAGAISDYEVQFSQHQELFHCYDSAVKSMSDAKMNPYEDFLAKQSVTCLEALEDRMKVERSTFKSDVM